MSDLDACTPRVFIARHGETEWTKDGRYTGITDLELTDVGLQQTKGTAAKLIGPGKLIDPARVVRIWVSPRKRALQTFDSLFGGERESEHLIGLEDKRVVITEDIAEWNYGDYEGLRTGEIKRLRKDTGLDTEREWSIWRDGCEGGESSGQIAERLDRLITVIREIQRPYFVDGSPADVVLVAHGLILRAFVKRWLSFPVNQDLPMMYAPGAIGVLSYRNQSIDEPGFYVGLAIPAEDA